MQVEKVVYTYYSTRRDLPKKLAWLHYLMRKFFRTNIHIDASQTSYLHTTKQQKGTSVKHSK